MLQTVRDSEGRWLSQSLLASGTRKTEKQWWQSRRKRYFSHIDFKFTDTTLGGDFTINNPPQFTRYADLRRSGRLAKSRMSSALSPDKYYLLPPEWDYGKGMGSAYSEKINDNSLVLYMCFGNIQYNSLTTFFTGFFNADAAAFARKGRSNGIIFSLGKLIGTVTALPLAPILFSANAIRFLANKPASKFSFLKENMPAYWQAVSTICNGLAVNKNIIKRTFGEDDLRAAGDNTLNPSVDMLRRYSSLYAEFYPGLFYENGGVDIYAVATRATRIANKQSEELYNMVEASQEDIASIVNNYFNNSVASDPGPRRAQRAAEYSDGSFDSLGNSLDRYLQDYLASDLGREETGETGGKVEDMGRAKGEIPKDGSGAYSWVPGYYERVFDFKAAEEQDGSRFVGFRVENFGTVSESFSTTSRETDLAAKFNSTSSAMKMQRVSFAQGNIGDGAVAAVLETATAAVNNLISGVASGLQLAGVYGYMGDAFVDIPETPDRSTANLPSMNYTMELRSPHGNPLALFQNIYIPLACILAGALPLSTGTHSYYHPFVASAFLKGAALDRFCYIDSLQITRGVGNSGWNKDTGVAMAIDVAFSIKPLSSIVHMPIAAGSAFNPASGVFDEDSSFNDYLAILGGLGVNDLTQPFRRLGLATTRKMVSYRRFTSPAFSAQQFIGNTIPGYILNALSVSQERP